MEKIEVSVNRTFGVSSEKVFDAWIIPDSLGHWMFGPEVRQEEIIALETEARLNGAYTFAVRRGEDVIVHVGKYLEYDSPGKLVFTWGVKGESDEESIVTVQLHEGNGGCELSLIHEMDARWQAYQEKTRQSWDYMLGKLEELLVRS